MAENSPGLDYGIDAIYLMSMQRISAPAARAQAMSARSRSTIAMVAEQAGVAASTVSRVLNGGYASIEVKERVTRAIEALSYTPSANARSLKLGRSGSIGVVVETTQGPWFTHLLGGIEAELSETKMSVSLGSLALRGHYDARQVCAWIDDMRVDGLVFARAGKREEPLVRAAAAANLPMAFVTPDEDFRVGHVFRAKNRSAGYEVGEHLIALGHRRIAFAGGPRDAADTQERLKGLIDRLRGAGIGPSEHEVWFADSYEAAAATPYGELWLSLPRDQAPTAVVAGNDALALGFMRVVQRAGVRIPRDLSVVGFDDVADAAFSWPGLTTASQPIQKMGSAAVRSLLEQIEDPEARGYRLEEFGMDLVERESTLGPA
jgi:LacI family transcriptional regulator